MAVVFSYPKIDSGDLQPADRLMISQMNVNGNPTKSLTLGALTSYIGAIPTGGTITGVTPDPPLIGGGTSGDVNIGIDPQFLQLFLQNPAILRNDDGSGGKIPVLNGGISATDVRNVIGAGTGDGDLTQLFGGDGINVVDPVGPNPLISVEYDGVFNFIQKCPNSATIISPEDTLVIKSFDAVPANRQVKQISGLDSGLAEVVISLDAADLNNLPLTPVTLIPGLPNGDSIKILNASFSLVKPTALNPFGFTADVTANIGAVAFFTLPSAELNTTGPITIRYSMAIAEGLVAPSSALVLQTTGSTSGTGVGEVKIKIQYQRLAIA